MSLILSGDTGVPVTTVTGTLPVANGGSGVTTSTGSGANVLGTSPSISGAVMTTMASSVLTSATAQNSTSGTSIDFTGIPSWVKRITVMFNGVSTNGTTQYIVQIGSGSVDTAGYISSSAGITNALVYTTLSATSGFTILNPVATNTMSGNMILTHVGSNVWVSSHTVKQATTNTAWGGGNKTALSGALDRVRITTIASADTFDAGSINILYE